MKPKRRTQIAEEAAALLREAEVGAPPIPVERLARLCDATLKFEPADEDISGVFFTGDVSGGIKSVPVIIGVNSTRPKHRQRFAIAHCIGHIKLHRRVKLPLDLSPTVRYTDVIRSRFP